MCGTLSFTETLYCITFQSLENLIFVWFDLMMHQPVLQLYVNSKPLVPARYAIPSSARHLIWQDPILKNGDL